MMRRFSLRPARLPLPRLALSLFAFLLCMGGILAQTGTPELILVGLPNLEGERVSLSFIARSADGVSVAGLTADNLALSERTSELSLNASARLPIATALIVSLSAESDIPLLQISLRAYLSSVYKDGDAVALAMVNPRQIEILNIDNRQALDAAIEGLAALSTFEDSANALQSALTWAQARQAEGRVAQGILFASYLNRPEEADYGQAWRAQGIPLHVVQAHRFRQANTETLRQLAVNSGGLFANNQDGRFVTAEGTRFIASSALALIYEAVNNNRLIYDLSYLSLERGLNAEQRVNLVVNFSASEQATLSYRYERSFQTPVLRIVTPNLFALRTPSRDTNGIISYDVSQAPVLVRVEFPDGVLRNLTSLRLEVKDARADTLFQSTLNTEPTRNSAGNYVITWDLSPFTTPDSTSELTLSITAEDELGLSASISAPARVSVANLPPPPTPIPLPTATPTPLPSPTPAPVTLALPTNNLLDLAEAQPSILLSLGALFGVVAFLLLWVFILLAALRRTRRKATLAQLEAEQARQAALQAEQLAAAASTSHEAFKRPKKDKAGNPLPASNNANDEDEGEEDEKPLLGRLIVLRGLAEREIQIFEPNFLIGRSAEQGCHLIIDEPFISPRHCAIYFREGAFSVRDMGGKNGTFVNGERVSREREQFVPIGSELAITQNIVVELWDAKTFVNVDTRHESHYSTHKTQSKGEELSFRPLLDIAYAADEDDVDNNYSPV